MKINILLLIILSSFIYTGCQPSSSGGTTTGNPVVEFTVTSSSESSTVASAQSWKNFFHSSIDKLAFFMIKKSQALPPPNSMTDSSGRSIVINEAWMVIRDIEFKPLESDTGNDGQEIELTGPYAINLLENNPAPLGSLQLNYSTLRRVRMTMHKLDFAASGAPSGLTNNAIYISGTVNGVSFDLSSDEGVEFEVFGSNGISPQQNSQLLMSIQIANLFKKVNLSNINSTTSISNSNKVNMTTPCPLINSSAADLYTCFKDGLKSEANFGIDHGKDNELDSNDDSVR